MSQESGVKEEENVGTQKAPVSRETRRAFVFFTVSFCLLSLVGMLTFGAAGAVAEIIALGFLRLCEFCVVFYVGGSILDNSEVLSKIADAVGVRRKR